MSLWIRLQCWIADVCYRHGQYRGWWGVCLECREDLEEKSTIRRKQQIDRKRRRADRAIKRLWDRRAS